MNSLRPLDHAGRGRQAELVIVTAGHGQIRSRDQREWAAARHEPEWRRNWRRRCARRSAARPSDRRSTRELGVLSQHRLRARAAAVKRRRCVKPDRESSRTRLDRGGSEPRCPVTHTRRPVAHRNAGWVRTYARARSHRDQRSTVRAVSPRRARAACGGGRRRRP